MNKFCAVADDVPVAGVGAGARAGVVAGGRHGSDAEGAVAKVEAAAADVVGLGRLTSVLVKKGGM